MIKVVALAALALQPASAPQCIPKERMGDVAVVLSPFAVDALARHCASHLPAGAFLTSGAGALSERLRRDGAGRVAAAAETLQRIMGSDVPAIRDKQALVQVVGEMGASLLTKDLAPGKCAGASAMVEALAPLPAENLALLVGAVAGLVGTRAPQPGRPDRPDMKKGIAPTGFAICKDG